MDHVDFVNADEWSPGIGRSYQRNKQQRGLWTIPDTFPYIGSGLERKSISEMDLDLHQKN